MKTNFFNLIFINEFRLSLDVLDAWAYDLVFHECPQKACILCVTNVVFDRNCQYHDPWTVSIVTRYLAESIKVESASR